MSKYKVEVISKHVCDLGEGPHWDPKTQTLYYVDLLAGDVCNLNPKTQESEIKHFGGITSVVIPVNNDNNELIISQGSKLYKINWNTNEKQLLGQVEQDISGNRFNDGKCDASGRLWVGTMGQETEPGVVEHDKGSLYSMDSSLNILREVPKVSLSNGIAWTADNKRMFFIDSSKRVIYSFDFAISSGALTNEKILVDFNKSDDYAPQELPDGMTIDINGNLWVACAFGGRVINIDSNTGKLIESIKLPTSLTTSVCFGGQKLNELYVTSAAKPLTDKQREKEPNAGRLFRITSNSCSFTGSAIENRFNA